MTTITTDSLYRLMAWLSPAYPTGAFSYSHGLEFAVEEGLVRDRATLVDWLAHVVSHGAGFVDAVLFVHAARAPDDASLDALADLAAAWRGTAETALESAQQGAAFLATTRAAWPDPALDALAARRTGVPLALPIAAGVACRAMPVPVAVAAYLQSVAASLVSAGVRLVPLGQTDGQTAIAVLAPVVAAAAARAVDCPLDDLGTAAPMVDWCSMRHETQYTRLFRS